MQKNNNIEVLVDFSGGLDLVFNGLTSIKLEITQQSTANDIINLLGQKYTNCKKQMFIQNGKLRPGILALINDMDWQLAQKENTKLIMNDKISFISTLHGG